jgi:hypothetical protein
MRKNIKKMVIIHIRNKNRIVMIKIITILIKVKMINSRNLISQKINFNKNNKRKNLIHLDMMLNLMKIRKLHKIKIKM